METYIVRTLNGKTKAVSTADGKAYTIMTVYVYDIAGEKCYGHLAEGTNETLKAAIENTKGLPGWFNLCLAKENIRVRRLSYKLFPGYAGDPSRPHRDFPILWGQVETESGMLFRYPVGRTVEALGNERSAVNAALIELKKAGRLRIRDSEDDFRWKAEKILKSAENLLAAAQTLNKVMEKFAEMSAEEYGDVMDHSFWRPETKQS